MDILKYKEYEGTTEIDMDRQVCRGKILFIEDLVTYEADSPAELRKEFEAAVDDYIETCATLGREAQKPLKGLFNVRFTPELHKSVTLRARTDDISLNEVMVRAAEAYVGNRADINHNVRVTVDIPDQTIRTLVASAVGNPQWETLSSVPSVTIAPTVEGVCNVH